MTEIERCYQEFYDKLPEPQRSQAKQNFALCEAIGQPMPTKLSEAIGRGFTASRTEQGTSYWGNIKKYIRIKEDKEEKLNKK